MSSLGKACLQELSNSIKGLRLGRVPSEGQSSSGSSSVAKEMVNHVKNTAASTFSKALKSAANRITSPDQPVNGFVKVPSPKGKPYTEPLCDDAFLTKFFWYFTPSERCILAQVCCHWRSLLYHPQYWIGVTAVYKCKLWAGDEVARMKFFEGLQQRGIESICLAGVLDNNVHEFILCFPQARKCVKSVCLRNSNITDGGLATLLTKMQGVIRLELSGCNEITEPGIWSSLNLRIRTLDINDCVNIADDSMSAICQLLPNLTELNLQAYHVTDHALGMFGSKQSETLKVLRLNSCWEITNHGVVHIAQVLSSLTVLGLSGCSKVTDDAVELIAENLRSLLVLDLSWCPRITDGSLEYIACDLTQLQELTLDRCLHVTDIGIGYISTMTALVKLFLRWCTNLRDFGLQQLCTMRNLQVLSIAGCNLVTPSGVMGIVHLRNLDELELTNCPGATEDVCAYLKESLTKCLLIK